MPKWTPERLRDLKRRERIVCVTAADCTMARLADEAGIHLILVGDSLATTTLGYSSTLPVTMDQMTHHAAAVVRGVKQALVVADMPFLSYQVSDEEALRNAGRFIKEAGADAVKLEGGRVRAGTIKRLVENGIPVLGHIGLTPQSIKTLGGYRVQGRRSEDAERLIAEATELEQAGVFALVVECVPRGLGAEITQAVGVPTIGIGAGPDCDGQILVTHDLLGFGGDVAPKFVRRYAELGTLARDAFRAFAGDVRAGRFPAEEQCY